MDCCLSIRVGMGTAVAAVAAGGMTEAAEAVLPRVLTAAMALPFVPCCCDAPEGLG